MPAGQVLIYPVIEPFFDTESYRKYSTGYVNTRDAMQYYWRQYLDDAMPSPEYLVAPARAESHEGLPPAVVVTAGFDVLHERGCVVCAAAAGGECACGASRLPRTVPRLPDDDAVRAGAAARELLWADMRRLLTVPAEASA